jgi:hypothetical protein
VELGYVNLYPQFASRGSKPTTPPES